MREAITQKEYEARLALMQGGRRCATCQWYITINEEQRERYVSCAGWCQIALPFKIEFHRQFKGIQNPQEQWCSLWEPDLVAIANGA